MKEQLRHECLASRAALGASERGRLSEIICDRAHSLLRDGDYEFILSYVGFGTEVATIPLIERLLAEGEKRVFCPRVAGERLEFSSIASLGDLTPGYRGILEPRQRLDEAVFGGSVSEAHRTMLVTPGVAFARSGERLGYGGGFFDRFIAAFPDIMTVGLAFSCQIASSIPMESHDRKVDFVVTEDNVFENLL